MKPKELEALLKVLKKYGVTHVKTADIELSLTEATPTMGAIDEALKTLPSALKTDAPTDEELLYWSSGGVPGA